MDGWGAGPGFRNTSEGRPDVAFNFKALVDGAYQHGASDIHLGERAPAYVRIDGTLRPVSGTHLEHADLAGFLKEIMPARLEGDLANRGGSDFAWQPDDRMRFRVSAYHERGRLRIVMRLIKIKIATIEELGLPEIVRTVAGWYRGMTLLTGVTGSGKSTTLAAMINYINRTESRCIITIEDPIELVHENIKSVVSQREVGEDVESFRHGLVQALRQDPDVILIGEMRSPETISTALRAAETGHYVFSTLHTSNALHTVERILAEFPESEHALSARAARQQPARDHHPAPGQARRRQGARRGARGDGRQRHDPQADHRGPDPVDRRPSSASARTA